MRNLTLSFLAICLLLLTSCSDKEFKKSLPDSSGKIDEIVVVIDDAQWKGEIGTAIREVLGENYPLLLQSEPRFDVRHIPFLAFQGLFRRSSTVLFVSPFDCESQLCQHTKEAFEHYEKADNDFLISFSNVYAKPQKIIYLSAANEAVLVSSILGNKKRIQKVVGAVEDTKAYRNAYASQVNQNASSLVREKFSVDCPIPKSYRQVIDEDNFLWFRQDLEGAVSNIVFHVKQLGENDTLPNLREHAIATRNKFGKAFVETDRKDSYQKTEMRIEPESEPIMVDGERVLETRGFWAMTDDFMGGVFISHTYFDAEKRRIITMDGWIFAPQWEKRPQIRRLEQIFRNAKYNF